MTFLCLFVIIIVIQKERGESMYGNINENLKEYYQKNKDQFVKDLKGLGILEKNVKKNEVWAKYFNDETMLKINKEIMNGSYFSLGEAVERMNHRILRSEDACINEDDSGMNCNVTDVLRNSFFLIEEMCNLYLEEHD